MVRAIQHRADPTGGPGRLIATVETYAENRDKKGATKRDIDPAIMLAQCEAALDNAKSLAIAREIVETEDRSRSAGAPRASRSARYSLPMGRTP